MDSVFIRTWMEPSTLGSGRKISSTDRGKRAGPMVLCMKETIYKERSKDKGTFNGQMVQSTLANLLTTILKELESTDGPMAEGTTESGATTRCMERVFSHGLMGGSMKVNT